MTPDQVATALLTVGGRSLWCELEAQETPRARQRPIPQPRHLRDPRAERLLLGCCLAAGELALSSVRHAGIEPQHFTEPTYHDLWLAIAAAPHDTGLVASHLDMMLDYLYAESCVNEDAWRVALADADPRPTQALTSCESAAEGLARRIVRLALVRAKLAEAERLLSDRTPLPAPAFSGGIRLIE